MQDVIDRVTRLHEAEMRDAQSARTSADIPSSYELMSPEWLTAILCTDAPGARVTGFSLGPEDDGTSNRRRIFIEYNRAGQDAGLPASVFCKASQRLASRLTLGVLGCLQSENAFYKHVRPQLDIEAPKALWACYDSESFASILVLGDLGSSVEFCDHRSKVTRARAESMVTLLATVHGRFYDSPALGGPTMPFPRVAELFTRLEDIGMHEYTDKGFLAAEHVIPPRLFARAGEIWGATIKAVAAHAALAPTMLHNDTHLRNWYISGPDTMGLADWQAMSIGNWSRDVPYAIACALTVEDRRAWEHDLLRLYLDKMREAGAPAIAFDEAWRLYRQQLFVALAFWTLTLTPPPVMPDMQPADITLAFIERFAHAIDDLDALASFD